LNVSLGDWLDLFVRVAMIVGFAALAVQAWKYRKPFRIDGRRYYGQADGSFKTAWGRTVTDPAMIDELTRQQSEREGRSGPQTQTDDCRRRGLQLDASEENDCAISNTLTQIGVKDRQRMRRPFSPDCKSLRVGSTRSHSARQAPTRRDRSERLTRREINIEAAQLGWKRSLERGAQLSIVADGAPCWSRSAACERYQPSFALASASYLTGVNVGTVCPCEGGIRLMPLLGSNSPSSCA
jgi:hypothetical protein